MPIDIRRPRSRGRMRPRQYAHSSESKTFKNVACIDGFTNGAEIRRGDGLRVTTCGGLWLRRADACWRKGRL